MSYAFNLVPYGQLHHVVSHLVPYLHKSEFWAKGRANIDDILRFLYTGQMQLWIVYQPETVIGYVITEVKEYPRTKMLVVQYCAGEIGGLEDAGEIVFGVLDQYAKDAGCAGIEFFGRPGWTPHAKQHGFTVQTVVYEKHFGEQP